MKWLLLKALRAPGGGQYSSASLIPRRGISLATCRPDAGDRPHRLLTSDATRRYNKRAEGSARLVDGVSDSWKGRRE